MKFTLSLTHRCNLACRYCYSGSSCKPDMQLATAKQCIDSALEFLPDGKSLDLGLFGGEPLLRFDLIKEIVSYTYHQTREKSVPVRIGITTNGTLISPEILDFFAEQGVNLCFSIDGPEDVHDRNRRYRNGSGSFVEVMRNFDLAVQRLGVVEVNAVVGPDTLLEVPRTMDFFITLGVRVIHLSPNIKATWTEEACNHFDDIFKQVSKKYIACFQRNREIALNLIDSKAILFVKGGYSPSDTCSMGDGEWGVAPSGNIYPCERFIGDDDNLIFSLGNISAGLNQARRCALHLKRGNRREECSNCFYKRFCMNWCGCTNWFMSGESDTPAPVLCAMEKAAIEAARHAFESLVGDDNDLFADHLLNYVNADNHHRDGGRLHEHTSRD